MRAPAGTSRVAPERLRWSAENIGEREFLRWTANGQRTSYAEMYEHAARWAGVLHARGVARGDRVLIMLHNCLDFLGAHFGAQFLGAIPVPINTELRGETLRHPIRLFEPAVMVIGAELRDVLATAVSDDPTPFEVLEAGGSPSSELAQQVRAAHPRDPVTLTVTDPSLIMSTSGTTGPSKGTVWNYGTLDLWATLYRDHLGRDETDRIYCCTPLFHANSLCTSVMAALNAGAGAVIAERFSVSGFWADIADNHATSTPLIGAMIELLLRTETPQMAADRERSIIRSILGACPPATHLEVERSWGITPVSAYGLTDFGSITHTSPGDGAPAGAVGKVVSAYEARLVDEVGAEVADGVAGELIVRPRDPSTIPDGYFRMPEATLASRKDLWFHTGDLLKRDPDGWFYFAGRVKDSMRRRGENVSAYDVEAAVLASGLVSEAAAYPLPSDEEDDEIAVAVVVPPGATMDPAALIEAAARELPYFAVPRFVRVLDELPKTPTQKVQKEPLRAAGVTPDTWDRVAAGVHVTRNPAPASA